MNLIVPMAGNSSRFPGLRPKWMLTHPNGRFMAIEAIMGLNLEAYEKIYFVYLKEHQEKYQFEKGFTEELEDINLHRKTELVGLDHTTRDQPSTVYQAIVQRSIKGAITIKDSDNRFNLEAKPENFVSYQDLNNSGLVRPRNKSYIAIDNNNRIINIVEKKVISTFFCVGAYGFKDADTYSRTYEKLTTKNELYISNIVFQCLLEKKNFEANPVTNYSDWGTLEDWDRFKKSYSTLFIDMDGVIVEHSASHFPPYYGETEGLKENVEILRDLRKTGKFQIIITTARPHKYRDLTIKQLNSLGIEFDQLLMNLFHSKRIIINDYSKSNPFKSCDSINLKRNSLELKDILKESLGINYDEI